MGNNITDRLKYKESVVKFSKKYGVAKAAYKFGECKRTIYRWRNRYDGTLESLKDKSRRPHSHPNQHTEEEIKLIKNYKRNNKDTGLVVLWIKLRKAGYTRTIQGLYHAMQRNRGKILNVASIAGFMPGPLMSTYYATKSYVVRLSESIREELKKENSKVQISILCPGPVDTNFNKVANVKFHMREANSQKVADYAIKQVQKGKFYIIPGIDVKFAKIGAKIAPASIVSKITYKIQKRKLQRK